MSIWVAYDLNSRLNSAGTLKLSGFNSWSGLRERLALASSGGGGTPFFPNLLGLLIFAMSLSGFCFAKLKN
jgi:hypothetical protein